MKLLRTVKLDVLYGHNPYEQDHKHQWYPSVVFSKDLPDYKKRQYMEGSQYKQKIVTTDFLVDDEGNLYTTNKELQELCDGK